MNTNTSRQEFDNAVTSLSDYTFQVDLGLGFMCFFQGAIGCFEPPEHVSNEVLEQLTHNLEQIEEAIREENLTEAYDYCDQFFATIQLHELLPSKRIDSLRTAWPELFNRP